MGCELECDAVLLVGHGTRNERGQQQFLGLAEQLRRAVSPLPVEIAYIELQSPPIPAALASLYERGFRNIALSPALLFAAGHAKRDIPAAVEDARQQCPGLDVRRAEPLGCHAAVLKLAAYRFRAACQFEPAETALVLVGRGSSDRAAIEHCQEFAQQLGQHVGACSVFTGFLAMAQPTLSEALELAAASGARQVIVQPHLLFAGEMLQSTTNSVIRAQQAHPGSAWSLAGILADDVLPPIARAESHLVAALIARLAEVARLPSR